MKIGIVGKGGSGKTTLSWLTALTAHRHQQEVYAFDTDFNQHLSAHFDMPRDSIKPLSEGKEQLIQYVLGERKDLTVAEFKKTTKPNADSRFVSLSAQDPFLKNYITQSPLGIHLLRIGEFGLEDKGWHCYHGLTAVADILLNHLTPLAPNQTLLIDFTAGVDPFASPITESLDAFILSVEPTVKGVEVARQWRHLLGNALTPLHIVVNKVQSLDEVEWVKQQLPQESVSTHLTVEPAIRRAERGESVSFTDLQDHNQKALETLWSIVHSATINTKNKAA